jgi:cell shape-determining protein MreC
MKSNSLGRRGQLRTAGVALALMSASLAATAQQDLRTRIEQLEQELQTLKRQLDHDREASAEKTKSTPIISAGSDGFYFRSANTNFLLRFRVTIQASRSEDAGRQ